MGSRNKKYSKEFKQDAINLYQTSDRTVEEVASDLKIGKSTLGKWIREAKSNGGSVKHRGSGNYSNDAEKEIARLKKQLRDKEDALEVLKKAISILND